MLQRSPTYILAMPAEDVIAVRLRRLLGARRGYAVTRWKNVAVTTLIYKLSRRRPDMIRGWIRQMAIKQLPDGYDVDTHFKPVYNPWDQRLCLVPDGDLFEAIRDGRASVVTDRVANFTERGVVLESGTELAADIVVTATGLQLLAFGGAELAVDGRAVRLPETMAYKGMMLSGVPNFAFTIGYTNASWTLKADLVSEFACRLLRHMDARGYDTCVPVNDDPAVTPQPLLDFQAGYVLRSIDQFPRAGSRVPWRLGMSYAHDVVTLRHGKIDDGSMRFSRAGQEPSPFGRNVSELDKSRLPGLRRAGQVLVALNRALGAGSRHGTTCTAIMCRILLLSVCSCRHLAARGRRDRRRPPSAQARTLPGQLQLRHRLRWPASCSRRRPRRREQLSCKPSDRSTPYPVVLVHGTFANMTTPGRRSRRCWPTHGYCVFALQLRRLVGQQSDPGHR